ncbi:MAG: fibrobacter succinogenes major paralogous domain-containing protein [Fibromonadales bacterium]|nr:fibrobacter succinogenes major paralogous domain-containing protein [Fibromonadales bacterium]
MNSFFPSLIGISLALALISSCSGKGEDENSNPMLSSSADETPLSSSAEEIPLSSSSSMEEESQTYKTVLIGSQTWMAENLNYDVPGDTTDVCYDNKENNCAAYGRLYSWATAMNLDPSCNSSTCANQIQSPHRGICPAGWHVPSDAEWATLINFAGGASTAGTKLKTTSGWNAHETYGNGTDNYDFSALPGGLGYSGGSFSNVSNFGFWWSAGEDTNSLAYIRGMYYSSEIVLWDYYDKSFLLSVRCLLD